MNTLGKLQFYTTLLKHIQGKELSKAEVREWLYTQIDELGFAFDDDPIKLLEFIQVGTRKFSEMIIQEVLLLKKELRKEIQKKEYFTAPEIYKRLNRTKGTFSIWKSSGWFKNATKKGKSWNIPVSDLEEFLNDHRKLKDIWEEKK